MNAEECLDLRKHILSEAENIEIVKKELSSDNVPEPFLPITNKHFIPPAMSPVTLQPGDFEENLCLLVITNYQID